ncbi:hypothetical protein OSTOST_05740 [Ostertagia ostertagi]
MKSNNLLHREHPPNEQKPPLRRIVSTVCYAVVALKSIASKEKLASYLMSNGFDDMLFVNDLCDHPIVKAAITTSASEPPEQPPKSQDSCGHRAETCVPEPSSVKEEHGNVGELSAVELIGDFVSSAATPSTSHSNSAADGSLSVSSCSCATDVGKVEPISHSDPVQSNERAGSSISALATRANLGDGLCSSDVFKEEEFRQRFRMTRNTFTALCTQLDGWQNVRETQGDIERSRTSSMAVKIGVVLDILAGNNPSVLETATAKSKPVPSAFDEVLDILMGWSEMMICWPDEAERRIVSANFFEMTGLVDVVGCIDGTKIWMAPTDAPADRNGPQSLNVGFVADDKMRFRWISAKFAGNIDDNTVFKRSILFEQFCDGTKKGTLIGDDSYQHHFFLLTPSHMIRQNSDMQQVRALGKAHETVVRAIQQLRNQFPILDGIIKLPMRETCVKDRPLSVPPLRHTLTQHKCRRTILLYTTRPKQTEGRLSRASRVRAELLS